MFYIFFLNFIRDKDKSMIQLTKWDLTKEVRLSQLKFESKPRHI